MIWKIWNIDFIIHYILSNVTVETNKLVICYKNKNLQKEFKILLYHTFKNRFKFYNKYLKVKI